MVSIFVRASLLYLFVWSLRVVEQEQENLSELRKLVSAYKKGDPTTLFGVPVHLGPEWKETNSESFIFSVTSTDGWVNPCANGMHIAPETTTTFHVEEVVGDISCVQQVLENNPNVVSVTADLTTYVPDDDDDVDTQSTSGGDCTYPWGLDRIDTKDLSLDNVFEWESGFPDGGAGANVYVFDTGINVESGDFEGRAINRFACFPTCEILSSCVNNDGHGHGTHVAGTVGGLQYGVAKHATIHGMQTLSATGSGSLSGMLNAMTQVMNEDNAIFHMSLGTSTNSVFDAAVESATSSGVIVVAASGNNGGDGCSYSPGSAASSLNVGAHNDNGQITSFSNTGSCVNMYAPGKQILSVRNTNSCGTRCMSGTSMAAPHVSGVVALIKGYCPNILPNLIRTVLPTWGETATDGTRRLYLGSTALVDQTLRFSSDSDCGASFQGSWTYCTVSACPTPSPTSSPTPPTAQPTPAPTPAPTPSLAPASTTAPANSLPDETVETEEPHAVGDPHVQTVTGASFDLWKTGWSDFVHIPYGSTSAELLVRGNVEAFWGSECAPAYLRELSVSGERLGGRTIMLRSGSLESTSPLSVQVDASDPQVITDGKVFLADPLVTVRGAISSPEPQAWGPDAQVLFFVGNLTIDVRQHTEGRFNGSRSMLDLTVHGLDSEKESVGGWLGADGNTDAGTPPARCSGVSLLGGVKGHSFFSK